MNANWKIRTVISAVLLIWLVFFAYKTKYYASQLQELKRDHSELRHVRYGLFNAELWRIQIVAAVSQRVNELSTGGEGIEQFRKPVEDMLYELIDEIDATMRSKNLTTFGGLFKQIFIDIFVDLQAMKNHVPQYADVVLRQMGEPQNMQKIQEMLAKESENLIRPAEKPEDDELLNHILDKYQCKERKPCAELLETQILQVESDLMKWTSLLASAAFVVFLLLLIKNPNMHPSQLTVTVAAALTLLFCGVTMPMIDLELIISRLDFYILGSEVRFEDQLLFYRSKSIWDLVWLMMSNSDLLLIITGFLILLFSILFPVSKMIASVVLVYSGSKFEQNALVNFLVYRSGKWSMADVTVVAIFMAYIGFDSIVESQMKHLGSAEPNLEILSFNGTDLQYGFYLFLLFTIAGLAISQKIQTTRGYYGK